MRWYHAFILFLILASITGCVQIPVCGLRPEYPKAYSSPQTVDSLQPTLRWERFPRESDLQAGILSGVGNVSNVSYDLMVWQVDQGFVLVYEQQDLPESYYKLEAPLLPSSEYLWTVRARFEMNGQVRVTDWAIQCGAFGPSGPDIPWPSRRSGYIPANYYRFKTPKR